MAEALTQYKLIVLYMLDQVDFPLTNTQISNFVLEKDYTTYFTIQLSYFVEKEMELKQEISAMADYYKTTTLEYAVRCQIKEKDLSLIDLTINVKTKEQAEAICANWKKQNEDVYTYLAQRAFSLIGSHLLTP